MNKLLPFFLLVLLIPFVSAGGNNGLTIGQCSPEEANYFYNTPDGPMPPGYGNVGDLYVWDGEQWITEENSQDRRIQTTLSGDENSINYTSSIPLNGVFTYESLGLAEEKVFWNTGYGHDKVEAREGRLYAVFLCYAYERDNLPGYGVPSGGQDPPQEVPTDNEVPEFSSVLTIGAVALIGVGLIIKRN